eukprot:9220348-Ditylum_brightwellii.AAC.1
MRVDGKMDVNLCAMLYDLCKGLLRREDQRHIDTAKILKKHPGALVNSKAPLPPSKCQCKNNSTIEGKSSNGQQNRHNTQSASLAESPLLTTSTEKSEDGRHGNRSDKDHQQDNLKWTTDSLDSEEKDHEVPFNKMNSAAPNQDVEQLAEVNDVLDPITV